MLEFLDKLFVWSVMLVFSFLVVYLYIQDRRRRASLTPEERRAEDDEMVI